MATASLAAFSPAARFRRWLEARLPATEHWLLTQRNIYIVPTRAGWAFAGMLLVMLLGAINYQLNLGYVLTFLLAGCALVSMHMTHATLKGLTLHCKPPQAGFAGEPTLIEIVVTNPGGTRHGIGIAFHDRSGAGRRHAWIEAPAQGRVAAQLAIVPARRGWHAVPTLIAETRFPLGLFRAWTVWRPGTRALAWPRPETPPPALPASHVIRGEAATARRVEGSELEGVRPWRRGDALRQIAWKKVARAGELVSRETSAQSSAELWLDYAEARAAGADPEVRLERLAGWVIEADRRGQAYGLRLPGVDIEPGSGDAHRRTLLDALARWDPAANA
jgi:uncharacterized protein (DUF58 family)